MGYKDLCYRSINRDAYGLLFYTGEVLIDRTLIQSILFFVVLNLSMLAGTKLLELANLPILCKIAFLSPLTEHCGSLYHLCKGH